MTTKKIIRRIVKRAIPIGIITYFYWPVTAVYAVASIYDVMRHKNTNKKFVFSQYFFENGTLTWMLSPLNMLVDILSLPFINKQVYQLDELPKTHQKEIQQLLDETPKEQLVSYMNKLGERNERTMLFYKWYGHNIDNGYPCPLFHSKFKRILTIGVSSFNAHSETSFHFGWLRAGVRVLINIDEKTGEDAYIDVNNKKHYWYKDGPLYIFDDTILHQSVNRTDKARNVLFIDVTRPTPLPFLFNGAIKFLGLISIYLPGFNKLSNWKVVK